MTQNMNYIGGQWVEASETNSNINPSDTSDCVGRYAHGDAQNMADAIDAAFVAKDKWRWSSIQSRADALDKVGTEILARKDELGELLAREEGKVRSEATGEVVRAGQVFKFFAGEALRLAGERIASVRENIDVEILREPTGVVGVITPWNFPIAIPAWKIAAALAYGNTVVFKPADLVPASAWALSEMLSRAGLPDGVFNLVMGRGSVVGDTLLNSPFVHGVTFTGSVSTGSHVISTCASRGAKVQAEMGGKNPLVVLDDADLDVAVSAALNGAFYGTGQRCTASSRLIVTKGIHDEFIAALTKALKETKVGHALDDTSKIGPVVSKSQLQQNLDYVEIGKSEGAELAFGGDLLKRETPGFYMQPALFCETENTMRINQEEIFGPVASVIRAADYDEAVAIANDVSFGLSSGICTTSLRCASDFKHRSAAGLVMVNLPTAGIDYHVPFGGRKASSYGAREQGSYAREFYTTVKTAYVNY
ncbi:aldehyde dehydrogenase family protein [Pseudohalocynthiibacter aestuariivivens]|nr:aldehyde dehydrogenase family protein [Pseudohalocynthiibacter aestuariivivens]